MKPGLEVTLGHRDHLPFRKSPRLTGFDYATAGAYFVTICTHHMEPRFGSVVNRMLTLNDAGQMVASHWETNIERYPGAALDAFVIMPNHLHAIVFLGTDPMVAVSGTSLVQIVRSFKSLTTVAYARGVRERVYSPFDKTLWQRSFHDRMLRDARALEGARLYIEGNPGRWVMRAGSEQGM
jgi:REP element-mobilizing transposase RayT